MSDQHSQKPRNISDAEIDAIWDRVDDWCHEGNFDAIDDELRSIDIATTDTDAIITYLTATLAAKTKLKYRTEFFLKAKEEIEKRNEMEDGFLSGLEP